MRRPTDAELEAGINRYMKPDKLKLVSIDREAHIGFLAGLIEDWRIASPDGTAVPCTAENKRYLLEECRDLRTFIDSQVTQVDAFRGEGNGVHASSITGSLHATSDSRVGTVGTTDPSHVDAT